MTEIYKILRAAEMTALLNDRLAEGAPVDVQDGFIHFSTRAQVMETAAKHFAGESDLWLLAFDAEGFADGALKWEPSRGGALFPHLYGPLRMQDVLWRAPVPTGPDGGHVFPDAPKGGAA